MTYTLINGVKQTAMSYNKYEIKYENGGTRDTSLNELLLDTSNNMCFENPLLFALFNTHQITDFKKTNITNKLNTSSKNIVIKVGQFGSGATTKDVSFGFVDNPPADDTAGDDTAGDDNPPTNVIFLNGSLFGQIKDDEVKKYALVLLEKYYNETDESINKPTIQEKKIIRKLCKDGVTLNDGVNQGGGNPTKDSTRSSQKKTRKKRKTPKK